MAYSAQVIRRAQDRLAQAKADRESEYRQHLDDAYARVPRLRQIDGELRRTMLTAAQAIFRQEDAASAMQQAREQNLALQQERQALIDANFAPGYLNEAPLCAQCGGTGYVGSTMCTCLQELCRQEQRKELTLLHVTDETFSRFRLDYYPNTPDPDMGVSCRTIMERTFRVCREYAADFSMQSPSLLFSGGTGLGKTFLSACIAREVADKGCSVVYESAAHLFTKLERAKFNGDEEARAESQKYTACDLLIIDDLGTEMGGQFVTSALYTLINDRLLSRKPTIISTNLSGDELAMRYSAPIISRLRGAYMRVAFVGEDIRLKTGWR